METLNQTQQRISTRGTKEVQRSLEKGPGNKYPNDPGKAESSHSRMGELLSHRCCQRGLQRPRQMDVPQSRPLHQAYAPQQIKRVATPKILGPTAFGQKGSLGVWRQANRSLPAQVQLVSD